MTPFRSSLLVAGLIMAAAFSSPGADAAAGKEAGWKPLFDGKTLNGWYVFLKDQNEKNKDPNKLVQIHDGAVHMYKDAEAGSTQPFGYIITEKEFSNYHLRLQYKWGEKKFAPRARPGVRRDAGLLYHTLKDKVWPESVECQIQEGDTGDIWAISTRVTAPVDLTTITATVNTNRTTGVVRTNYQPVFQENSRVLFMQGDVGPSLRIVKSETAEQEGWNTVEVIIRGDTATHIVNGKVNNRCANMQQWSGDKWVPLTKGKIALQLEGAEVFYRNIEIKALKD